MLKELAGFIVRGRWQAILVTTLSASVTYLLPPLVILLNCLAGTAVALVALHVGVRQSVPVLLVSALLVSGLFSLLGTSEVATEQLLLILVLWLPCWLAATMLRLSRRLDYALLVLTLFGICGLGFVYGYFGDPVPWWMEKLQESRTLLSSSGLQMQGVDDDLLLGLAGLMTGYRIARLVVSVSAGLLLARWWQSLLVHPGAFGREFAGLRLGNAYGLATLGVMLVAQFVPQDLYTLLAQLAMIMLMPFLLSGLAVLHVLARQASRGKGWLVAVYVLMVFIPFTGLFVAAGGLLDTWIDFRRRLRPGRGSGRKE